MIFVFDLDQTIWDSTFERAKEDFSHGKYIINGYNANMLLAINDLYDKGNIIILQTARHWDKFEQTKKQLEPIKYHTLVMGNVVADMYINDKGETPEGFLKFYEANFKQGGKQDG